MPKKSGLPLLCVAPREKEMAPLPSAVWKLSIRKQRRQIDRAQSGQSSADKVSSQRTRPEDL